MASSGITYLVGAGPGDPGLITVRGTQCLAEADLVVYDALANPRLLSHCRPEAELIYVGKRAASHSWSQEQINQLLVERTKRGLRVVRLKGGDPFVFGRGGEECEALAAEGLSFEVVPGITAAIAAPAYAGIPVTHRDLNSSFSLITGHEKEQAYLEPEAARRASESPAGASDLDYAALARLPGFAFYMGIKSLARICQKLIDHGMDPATPAATVQWGTLPRQRTVTATLSTLAEAVEQAKLSPPAITIVGKVVSLREKLNWFERRPLFGRTIAVTRTRQQASDLSRRLEALGAEVIEAPTIELVPPSDWSEVDAALDAANAFDWVIFTSANGVRAVRERLSATGRDARCFGQAKIAAIGDATAAAVAQTLCLKVDLCPESFVAEALADALEESKQLTGRRFLLLRADIARPLLAERLVAANAAEVRDVAVYQTRSAERLPEEFIEALESRRLNWITFTSSSTFNNLWELLTPAQRQLLQHVKRASIGPITTRSLSAAGLPPAVEASRFNIDGVIAAILANESS